MLFVGCLKAITLLEEERGGSLPVRGTVQDRHDLTASLWLNKTVQRSFIRIRLIFTMTGVSMSSVKRILAVLLVSIVLIGAATAASSGNSNTGNENAASNNTVRGDCGGIPLMPLELKGSCSGDQPMTQTEIGFVLQEQVALREQQLNQFLNTSNSCDRETVRNQNTVRLSVYSMLVYGALDEGDGEEISQLATDFNESYKTQVQAEQRIQTRNDVMSLFAGGDEIAAAEILAGNEPNQQRITRMQQLVAQCDCDAETRLFLQEQLQVMEQDQLRLREMAELELSEKGLLGWLWK